MASLVKKDGKYGLIWTDNSRQQTQTRESLKTENKTEAKKRKARLENRYYTLDAEGKRLHDPWKLKWYQQPAADQGFPLSQLIEEFILYKSRARGEQGWSDAVQKRETYVMRKFAQIVGENREVEQLNARDLQRFYYRDGVTSDHTRKGDYISVNTFLNWAMQQSYLDDKPKFKPKRPQRKIPKFIYPEQLAALIQYRLGLVHANIINGDLKQPEKTARWLPLIWLVMASTGLRRKEVVHLKKSHIERNSIIIGEDFMVKVRAERRVPLLFEAKWAVEQLMQVSGESKYLTGKKPNYAQQKLTQIFSGCWKARFPAGPKRTLYNLKDMFAVRFLCADLPHYRSGMKMNDLKEIFGHASLETTQKYVKAVPPGTIIDGSIWDFIEKF